MAFATVRKTMGLVGFHAKHHSPYEIKFSASAISYWKVDLHFFYNTVQRVIQSLIIWTEILHLALKIIHPIFVSFPPLRNTRLET
jgi:hypothetical protein